MRSTPDLQSATPQGETKAPRQSWWLRLFLRLGVLPFLLAAAVAIFALQSPQFLTADNLFNLLRQSVYLILVSLGQMLALATGGFDLSVGTVIALTSVVSATVMTSLGPESTAIVSIVLGCGAGLMAGLLLGLCNGLGVAVAGVSPFIMTLGVQSIGLGIALALTGGVPVSGLPPMFSETLGFGVVLGLPMPVWVVIAIFVLMMVLMNRTATGIHLLAVGGNSKAANLSGISIRRTYLLAYVLCALLASVAGLLLTALVDSGEANLGASIALESIAACVIAGVSLRGGVARVENVVLGAIFIGLVQNGMNLTNVGSYMQMVVLGVLLIVAVVADQVRHRLMRADQ